MSCAGLPCFRRLGAAKFWGWAGAWWCIAARVSTRGERSHNLGGGLKNRGKISVGGTFFKGVR